MDTPPSHDDFARRARDAEAQRIKVRAAMAGLDEGHRTILRLVHEDGLRLVDAAVVMGRSPDAVRILYGSAITALADRTSRRG